MGKSNRQHDQRGRSSLQHAKGTNGVRRRQHSQSGKPLLADKNTSIQKHSTKRRAKPSNLKVPFSKHDKVLLVGEGDFSFSWSLAKHYKVGSIVSTSFDDETVLLQKHPQVDHTVRALKHIATVPEQKTKQRNDDNSHEQDWNGFSSEDEAIPSVNEGELLTNIPICILHGIDAPNLSKKHRKALESHAPFTKIVFNFPHTGGLSTDVNRQVRANQELLVGFFNAAKPYLATRARPAVAISSDSEHDDLEYDSAGEHVEKDSHELSSGQILVTLFEGEPYSLWNIRDLARHCGLQVIESFKFPWAAYPGYKHARTIGDITTGKDRSKEGKRKGAWRGEERDARCYVLGVKDEVGDRLVNTSKRKRRDESDDSD